MHIILLTFIHPSCLQSITVFYDRLDDELFVFYVCVKLMCYLISYLCSTELFLIIIPEVFGHVLGVL